MLRISAFAIAALIILAHTRVAEADAVPLKTEFGTLVVSVLINEETVLSFTIDSAASEILFLLMCSRRLSVRVRSQATRSIPRATGWQMARSSIRNASAFDLCESALSKSAT